MKGKILVLDTAVFMKSVPIWEYAEKFYTCREVIQEIRDKQAKMFYKSLPVEVNIKEPSAAALKFIIDFSKKTGDYPSLSLADSKVLALTYELDIEANGGSDHLRKEPEQSASKTVTNITTKVKTTYSVPKNIPGFYFPRKKKSRSEFGSEFSSAVSEISIDEDKDRTLEPKPQLLNELNARLCDNSYLEGYTASDMDFDMANQLESYFNTLRSTEFGSDRADEFKANYPHLHRWLLHIIILMEETEYVQENDVDYSDLELIPEVEEQQDNESIAAPDYSASSAEPMLPETEQSADQTAENDGWQTVSRKPRKYTSSTYAPSEYTAASVVEDDNLDSDYNSDDDGWINSSNIHLLTNRTLHEVEESKNALAACISADFAVQNVLKHIGLQAIGVDGKLIKRVKSYLLRCYACFKLSSSMERIFCFHCGNKTLKRVAVSVNDDGSQEIWINATRPINTKGINKPIPFPQGGKYSMNPILVADQRFPQQRLSKMSRKKTDPLHENYLSGGSYFATRDIYSRAAVLGRIEGNNPHKVKSKRKR